MTATEVVVADGDENMVQVFGEVVDPQDGSTNSGSDLVAISWNHIVGAVSLVLATLVGLKR